MSHSDTNEDFSEAVPQSLRIDYTHGRPLDEPDMAREPADQFRRWFDEAVSFGVHEPNAMALATVSAQGAPSVRIVLLKDFDTDGFTFFTNYTSHKGHDLAANPHASAVFYWREQERQVRVDGAVHKLPADQSEAYFHTRPREAQIGAWASHQSAPLASRHALEAQFQEIRDRYQDQPIPLPPFWGGYLIVPSVVEFWQGRGGRLHDRLVYRRQNDQWQLVRLSP